MHRSIRENFDMENLMEERDQRDHEEGKRQFLEPLWSKLKEYPLAQLFGGGEAGRKIAQFILAVKNDRQPESDLLPTDKFAHEEASPEEAEPVKPPRKRRTVKQAGKTRLPKAANPLEEKEMEGGKKEESSQHQSKSIKLNQSDLESQSPTRQTCPPCPPHPIFPADRPEAGDLQKSACPDALYGQK